LSSNKLVTRIVIVLQLTTSHYLQIVSVTAKTMPHEPTRLPMVSAPVAWP